MKVDVPPNEFDRALKRFASAVREHNIIPDAIAQTAFRSKGEERRIARRRGIKRRLKAEQKLVEIDAMTTPPESFAQKRLRNFKAELTARSRAGDQ
jgi:ribosomal protein S21